MSLCPCGSGMVYLNCCAVFINGNMPAPTPEALMRSRYTAYTQQNMDYIEKTMKGPALVNFNKQRNKIWVETITWHNLQVCQATREGNHGMVEFIAHYSTSHQKKSLHERSQFTLEGGRWYYVDGTTLSDLHSSIQKTGRNAICACGSGKKFKKCCLK